MAEIIHQTDGFGRDPGAHYIEFRVNGKTVQIMVSDSEIEVISPHPFESISTRSINSVKIRPAGSPPAHPGEHNNG